MGKPSLSDEFKRDEMTQSTEQGYGVVEVSELLGVNQHSQYGARHCHYSCLPLLSSPSEKRLGHSARL